MTLPDLAEHWRRYWASAYDGGRRRRIEDAVSDPLGGWLVVEAPTVVEDVGIDGDSLRDRPDDVLGAAAEGFAAFVEESSMDGPDDDRIGYDLLTIHVTGVGRVSGTDFGFSDPVEDANTVVEVRNVRVTDTPRKCLQAGVVTYRCPVGHETTIRRPRHRSWEITTCGHEDCSNAVVPDDTRTRARRTVEFAVEFEREKLPCIAGGRYAATDEDFERLVEAKRLFLTGIPRLVADAEGGVDPAFEVLHAEGAGT